MRIIEVQQLLSITELKTSVSFYYLYVCNISNGLFLPKLTQMKILVSFHHLLYLILQKGIV